MIASLKLAGNASLPLHADAHTMAYTSAMEDLIGVIQELSHARDIDTITEIVRDAARNLTGADGATFVLRDGNNCYYADENTIAPLWKGRRFPMDACVSGWVMMNAAAVVIEDIYADSRVPASVYRPTFVKSLAMVPIRKSSPIGAIGNYWATHHRATEYEMALMQALADTTSVALENVDLYSQIQGKISELEESNYALSCFAWAASHDLQEPLRTIITQVELLQRRCHDTLDERALDHIRTATESAGRLQRLIADMLVHARAGKQESFRPVALSDVMVNAKNDLEVVSQDSKAIIDSGMLPEVNGNPHLLECLLRNLISNAIKFRAPGTRPYIKIACRPEGNEWFFTVTDNGIGIEPQHHQNIFGLFQRLHNQDQHPGSGIGLATCRKIVELHGGRIWVESAPDKGSTFCFTLPAKKGS